MIWQALRRKIKINEKAIPIENTTTTLLHHP
jgi:hypothetical protein